MKPNNLIEILDIYDYIKANCSDSPLWSGRWDLKTWLSGVALTGGLYCNRGNKRITSVFFGWPIEALEEDEKEPQFSQEGTIFYVPFWYSPKKKEEFPRLVAQEALLSWPDIQKIVFVDRAMDENGMEQKSLSAFEIAQPEAVEPQVAGER